jgi:hypothetical protein
MIHEFWESPYKSDEGANRGIKKKRFPEMLLKTNVGRSVLLPMETTDSDSDCYVNRCKVTYFCVINQFQKL